MSKPKKNETKKQKQRPTIGFFNLEITNDWALWPWQGIVDATRQHDVNLVTFVGRVVARNDYQANVLYDLARDSRLDGLIIWKAGLTMILSETEVEQFCRQYNIPVVTLEGSLSGSPCVSYENYQGMRKAVDHLIETHGYQKIGFLGMYDTENFQERYQGYVDAMTDHGLTVDPQLARPSFPKEQIRLAKIIEPVLTGYLDHAAEVGMEAVIGVADSIAQQVQQKLQQRGVRVPEEVAVVGFDDFTEGRVLTPPLTTVMPSWYELGHRAAETLIDVLAGESVPDMVTVPSVLKVRQSCGCGDAFVAAATTKPNHTPVSLNLPEATTELVAVAQASELESIQDELQPLLKTFTAELNGEETDIFLKALDDALLRSMDSVEELSHWHNIIAALRQQVLPSLKQQDANTEQAETLLQQAQVLVSRVAERTQMSRSFRAGQKENNLRGVGLSLITTLDVDALTTTLANGLPGLDIPSCYLSLFENPQPYHYPDPAPEWSRLILAYNPQGRVELPPGGQRFSSHQLIPNELWPQDRACSFVLISLHFQEEQIGFALLESGSRQGKMYETLGTQISSALQGALLMDQIQENTAEITRQKNILDTFMDNVPDTIYFKDLDSRITQVNRALANRLGLDDPTNAVGLTDFDLFPEDVARPKYEQEQEIIRTGRPLLALEEPDAGDRWALTTKMPLRNEHNEIIGTFGISRDITAMKQAQKEIKQANQALEVQVWQTTGQAELNDKMRGEQNIETLANNIVRQLCRYLNAQIGALYLAEDDHLTLVGRYAYSSKNSSEAFKFGEGLVGQAALEKEPAIITNIPDNYITVRSGLGETTPRHIMVFPFVYEDQVAGVIEMATLDEFDQTQLDFLQVAMTNIGIAFNTAQTREHINELLMETQQQAEELQTQGDELRVANEELAAQTESLRISEAQLKEKQTELESTNTQLEEKAAALEESSAALQEKQAILDQQNRELMIAQEELERKAKELALASKYKSEFLANMSHELRTPLNSLLILARMLADNKDGNLTEDQVESAQIIYSGGNDLLNLINDILDLSKVEAGQMIFTFESMPLTDLVSTVRAQFDHVAEEKSLDLKISLADDLPPRIKTDPQRIKQIVKNLLSNAFKFTSQGSVSLNVYRPDTQVDLSRSGLEPSQTIAISVADTGIGMTPEQQKVIFEAFQQADGSTSRQFGGTGLGLSISRELSAKLGGQIDVASEPGQGSTFTLYLPIERMAKAENDAAEPKRISPSLPPQAESFTLVQDNPQPEAKLPVPQPTSFPVAISPSPPDDRADLAVPEKRSDNDKILLIIEDDPKFAKIMYDYSHRKGFKCLIVAEGKTGLELVKTYQPNAIILDLNLPDISGWEVLTALKNDPNTRHIPVHIISADEEVLDAYRRGAMGYLTKPVEQEGLEEAFEKIEGLISRQIKTLLVVEDDAKSRRAIKKLLNGSDVQISETEQGQAALDLLKAQHFDCMILDLSLPDMSGFEVLNKINHDQSIARCPVIVYTGRDLTPAENEELMQYADSVIVKGVKSPERLLDETALFLHRVVAEMPQDKQQTIKQLYTQDDLLEGKRVLIVDDDMRNSFALSKLLSDKGIKVKIAPNGQKALDLLAEDDAAIDLILMDIMMPVLDGYETIGRIRAQQRFKTLPILALTAKAMKGDREKCLRAGANDYLPKPVDVDRLFSMLRVWLYQ